MNTSKNKIKSLMLVLFFSAATISTASARVCFLPDSTDCGEGDVVGSSNVDVPCQYSNCPAYNTKYQTCYTERIYNNGGVNVECKQVKCSLSKSDCEKQEADPNSSQCCNFDSASGCYYMGSCKLCNRDVYDSEKNLGEGYNCYPCKDKNGTFYNCTAIEKECKDINSNYTSSCGDSQTAEEVKGVKDSHGNQCYTCKDKPIGCTYEYRQATTADSCGLTDLNTNYQCMDTINGCQCYTQLIKVSSVTAGAGYVVPYNKISNKSATCVDEKGVTRYQKICQGTRKSSCNTKNGYEFKPNGCVSDTYNNGFEVKGDEWGDCVKKEEKCLYEYRQATVSDSNGVTGNLDDGRNKCTNGSQCWINLRKITSLDTRDGTPSVNPINKISNQSASCTTLNGVTKYETICEGTPKSDCFRFTNDNKFTPNGCVSDAYNNGFEVKGDEWGTCGCDTDKGAYDTIEECRSGTNSSCGAGSGGCYKTCESQGYYSTEEACLNSDYKVTCTKTVSTGDCYKREMQGFLIKYDTGYGGNTETSRKVSCSRSAYSSGSGFEMEAVAYLETVSYDSERKIEYGGLPPETIDGKAYYELPDEKSKGYQYPAGTYYLCYQGRYSSAIDASDHPGVNLQALQLLRTSDYNPEFIQEVCFTGGDKFNGYGYDFEACEGANDDTSSKYPCKKVTFEAGKTYKVRFAIDVNSASCHFVISK